VVCLSIAGETKHISLYAANVVVNTSELDSVVGSTTIVIVIISCSILCNNFQRGVHGSEVGRTILLQTVLKRVAVCVMTSGHGNSVVMEVGNHITEVRGRELLKSSYVIIVERKSLHRILTLIGLEGISSVVGMVVVILSCLVESIHVQTSSGVVELEIETVSSSTFSLVRVALYLLDKVIVRSITMELAFLLGYHGILCPHIRKRKNQRLTTLHLNDIGIVNGIGLARHPDRSIVIALLCNLLYANQTRELQLVISIELDLVKTQTAEKKCIRNILLPRHGLERKLELLAR